MLKDDSQALSVSTAMTSANFSDVLEEVINTCCHELLNFQEEEKQEFCSYCSVN